MLDALNWPHQQCESVNVSKQEKKCERREGTNAHTEKSENVAKDGYNLIGLNIYKLFCHVQRIMGPCVCAVILMMATEHFFPICLSVRRFRFH